MRSSLRTSVHPALFFCSRVRYPMLLAPSSTEHLACISRHVSKPLPCMFCVQVVDAGPAHVLTKRYCRLLISCIHCSATGCEGAAVSSWSFVTCPVDCPDCRSSLLYAGSSSSKVLYYPVNRGGDILYLWIPSSCCSCGCCCCRALWGCVGAHPG